MARKIIGIGETIMDIIFKDGQPVAAVPGGSVFNGIISLGRMGLNVTMITETGSDRVGDVIERFMNDNGVDTKSVCRYSNGRSAISLAWLNEQNDAEYSFYKDYPNARLDVEWPDIQPDDIIMMGSYFVLNPVLRSKVEEFLQYARQRGALIYYDFNYRSSHKGESVKLYSSIIENLDYADIVRGSTEDFDNIFGTTDAESIYQSEVKFHCDQLICTDGGGKVTLTTPHCELSIPVSPIKTVSTIGAGDNFNAGVVYGLVRGDIRRDQLHELTERQWNDIINCGMAFAKEVVQSFNNSISPEFASRFQSEQEK